MPSSNPTSGAAASADSDALDAAFLASNKVHWERSLPYVAFNLAALAGLFVFPPHWKDLALCLSLYSVRMFAVGGGLHRYFSHKSFSTSRGFQFALALVATTVGQQGVLWWASAHRHHHRTSDGPLDFHSPTQSGWFWAHQLWVFTDRAQVVDLESVRDLACYPELRWLNRYWAVPHFALVGILFLAGGLRAVEWGFFVSTVLLWQVSFAVNSLAHLLGTRRYATRDTSRNNLALAIVSLGDGWHNNHHYYPGSARAGFYWWEIDPTYYAFRLLGWLGLIWDIREPTERVLAIGRVPLLPGDPRDRSSLTARGPDGFSAPAARSN